MRDLPEFRRGQPVSARKLTSLRDELEILSKLKCESPLEMDWSTGGPVLRLNQAGMMWAMLLRSAKVESLCGVEEGSEPSERTGYSWQELDFDKNKGCLKVAVNGQKGQHAGEDRPEHNLAFEFNSEDFSVNNDPEGPIKDVVILWPGYQDPQKPEWLFSGPSKRGFKWVALMERGGTSYMGIEMEPKAGGGKLGKSIRVGCGFSFSNYEPDWCEFAPIRPLDAEGRPNPTETIPIGPLYNENCRSDNCQGGKHPEIVKAYPNTDPDREGTYLFAYGDAYEEDDERQIISSAGDQWRRHDASCKGFILGILGISA